MPVSLELHGLNCLSELTLFVLHECRAPLVLQGSMEVMDPQAPPDRRESQEGGG